MYLKKTSTAVRKIIGNNVLIYYPNFIEILIIHTDARKMQLGGVISQNGNPTTYYSHKLKPTQTN